MHIWTLAVLLDLKGESSIWVLKKEVIRSREVFEIVEWVEGGGPVVEK